MLSLHPLSIPNYEKVIEVVDSDSQLHAFIAIHSTALGPSLGGIRMYPYTSKEDALKDVLALSEAMSYKSALAETGLGGGKSVIIGNPRNQKTEPLLFSFAEAINQLKGSYIAAEDMGINTSDMLTLQKKTPYIAALPTEKSSGDPSRFTAFGIFKGIEAVGEFLWKSTNLKGITVAIQGLGNVGSKLASILFWKGAHLLFSDSDFTLLEKMAKLYGAKKLFNDEIYTTPCDIFAPCAIGGILNERTIPLLKCQAVAGSANNQLVNPEAGRLLKEKGILYAPDYAINAGGIINVAFEFDKKGYNPILARDQTARIYDTLLTIFQKAKETGKSTEEIADEMAEYKLLNEIGKRKEPLSFSVS